jgi:acetoin utilization protein AcuA
MKERVTLTPCAGLEALQDAHISPALNVFRPPAQQLEALVKMAADPKCCVSIAMDEGTLVGYAAFHPPSAIESWGDDQTGEIIELGAVEVDPGYRGQRLAERLLEASFAGGRFDRTVVFATMYVWHYDTKRTGLSDFQYRRMLERLYRSVGMERMATSDPEIRSDAANALMVRVGPACPERVRQEFERLRTRPRRYN